MHCRIMDTSSHSSQNPGTFSYAAPELILNGKLDVKVRLGPGMTATSLDSKPCLWHAYSRLLLLLRAILSSAFTLPVAQHPGAAFISSDVSGFSVLKASHSSFCLKLL